MSRRCGVSHDIACASTATVRLVVSSAESEIRPTWRGWFHAVAFAVAIPAGIALIAVSDRAAARTSAVLYVLSLTAMFGLSAAYHRLARSETARRRMQRLDHAGIFLLIAGTYVPITMVAFPSTWGIPVMAVIGTAAVAGIVMKLAAFERSNRLSYLLYPAMGWTAVFTLPVLVDRLTPLQLAFIVAGGVVYSLGIPVLMFRRPNPWPKTFGYHEIWHGFVVVAASLHFAAVSSMLA
jgi:hemolysin III